MEGFLSSTNLLETLIDLFVVTILGGLILHILKKIIDNRFFRLEEKISDEISLKAPPTFDDKLVGRKSDIKKLRRKLTEYKCVWISAIGGIGKSTLAIVYAQKYKKRYKHIYWLSWKGTLQKTLEDEINVQNPSMLNKETLYNKIIHFYREKTTEASLLIIDGMDDYNRNEIDIINSFNCKILITSRMSSTLHQEYSLNMLSTKECKKLFCLHAKTHISSQQLEKIWDLTDGHTLSIKLFARYARVYSVEKLFSDILNSNISDLQNKIEIIDGEPNIQVMAYYTQIYKITYDAKKKNLLMNLSILPSNDLNMQEIEDIIGQKNIIEDIIELEKLGWIIRRNKKSIYLHPILANTIRQISVNECTQAITYKQMIINCNNLTAVSLDDFDDYNNKIRFVPYCESIIKYYCWKDVFLAQMMMNVSSINYIIEGDYVSALKYAEIALDIFLEHSYNDEKAKLQYANALTDISEYYYKENPQKAIEIEENALKIKEALSNAPNKELHILKSYNNLMLYHHHNFDNDYLSTAWHIMEKYQENIKNGKRISANIYNHFALLLHLNKYYKKSIVYLKKAENILVENHAETHYMYPFIVNTIGGTYGDLSHSKECLDEYEKKEAQKNALKYLYKGYHIKKQKHHKPNSSIAISLHNIATMWSLTNHNFLALFYEYKSLKIRKEHLSEQLYLASSFLRLGIIFKDLYKKFNLYNFKQKGIQFLEAAIQIYMQHRKENENESCQKELESCHKCLDWLNNH